MRGEKKISKEQQDLIFKENSGLVIEYLEEKRGSKINFGKESYPSSVMIDEIITESELGKSYVINHVLGVGMLGNFFAM